MGVLRKFFNQTGKPEGRLGRIMLRTMNAGHAKMADWGMSHLPQISPENIVEIGCGAGRNAGELLKKYPQAHVTGVDYFSLSVEKAKAYNQKFEKIIDGMKTYTAEELETTLRTVGFSEVTGDHYKTRPWITVIARK